MKWVKKICCDKPMIEVKDQEAIINGTVYRFFVCEQCEQGMTYIKIEGYDEV